MGGTLHGCELGEFLVKRHRRVIIAHNGPASELGDEMGRDDLANLWPWFKQKYVTLWPEVEYREITEDGLKIQQRDKRSYILKGKNVINTQDWAANTALVEQLVAAGGRDPGGRQRPGAGSDGRRGPRRRTRRLRRLTAASGRFDNGRRGHSMFELLEGAPPYREDDAEDYRAARLVERADLRATSSTGRPTSTRTKRPSSTRRPGSPTPRRGRTPSAWPSA